MYFASWRLKNNTKRVENPASPPLLNR